MTTYDIFLLMSKRFLSNILKRRFNFKFSLFGSNKKGLGVWGEKQIEKIGFLGQNLVVMQTN